MIACIAACWSVASFPLCPVGRAGGSDRLVIGGENGFHHRMQSQRFGFHFRTTKWMRWWNHCENCDRWHICTHIYIFFFWYVFFFNVWLVGSSLQTTIQNSDVIGRNGLPWSNTTGQYVRDRLQRIPCVRRDRNGSRRSHQSFGAIVSTSGSSTKNEHRNSCPAIDATQSIPPIVFKKLSRFFLCNNGRQRHHTCRRTSHVPRVVFLCVFYIFFPFFSL